MYFCSTSSDVPVVTCLLSIKASGDIKLLLLGLLFNPQNCIIMSRARSLSIYPSLI